MLRLSQLTKKFDGIEAVSDFDLEVKSGKITALIGPNGAGKTTLFNLISGFISATRGESWFQEQPLSRLPPYAIARLGIARTFQQVKLFRTLTVMENLLMARRRGQFEGLFPALLNRASFQRFARQKCDELLEQLMGVNLADKAYAPASALSYGQSKLVEILRAVACDPQLLLLDEPVAGLHPSMITSIKTLLLRLVQNTKTTLFLIEHNIPFVLDIADWVVVMDHGVKIAEGPPEEIKHDPKVIAAYLG